MNECQSRIACAQKPGQLLGPLKPSLQLFTLRRTDKKNGMLVPANFCNFLVVTSQSLHLSQANDNETQIMRYVV
jgi:hypothetical protein